MSVSPEEFASEYWSVAPLLSRAAELSATSPGGFGDLFSNDAVDELVSRRGLRTPFLRVAKAGDTLPDRAFTDGGGVGATIADQVSDDKLLRLFADGATIVLQGLHRTWEPVLAFTQDLSTELGHPVQVNAYVTPPQSTGFSDHYDVHDVFVLQIAGEKRWRIRPPVLESPLRDQAWSDRRAAVEEAATHEPLIEATLRPGDCLYLPRGFLHAATALGDVSTHLTIGIHPWTRRHLADELTARALAEASEDPRLRASLGVGTQLADPASWDADLDVVREALVRAIRQVPASALTAPLAARASRAGRAAPIAPVAQLRTAARLADDDTLTLRGHLQASLVDGPDGGAVLRSRAGDVSLSAPEVAPVRALVADGFVAAGRLDAALARRLLLAGIVTTGGAG